MLKPLRIVMKYSPLQLATKSYSGTTWPVILLVSFVTVTA